MISCITYTSIYAINKKCSHHPEKKAIETRIIKNIFNKMKEDVGMSKPKKHANKVGRLT